MINTVKYDKIYIISYITGDNMGYYNDYELSGNLREDQQTVVRVLTGANMNGFLPHNRTCCNSERLAVNHSKAHTLYELAVKNGCRQAEANLSICRKAL